MMFCIRSSTRVSDACVSFKVRTVLIVCVLAAARVSVQWCGVGFTQLPNGIGFGGQVGHYGLWLDSTMDHGMSRPAATFARCAA
jgi:hypothetical protein